MDADCRDECAQRCLDRLEVVINLTAAPAVQLWDSGRDPGLGEDGLHRRKAQHEIARATSYPALRRLGCQLSAQYRSATISNEVTAYLEMGIGRRSCCCMGQARARRSPHWAARFRPSRTFAGRCDGSAGLADRVPPSTSTTLPPGCSSVCLMDRRVRSLLDCRQLTGRPVAIRIAPAAETDRQLVLMGSGGLIGMTPGLRQLREYVPSLRMTSDRDCFLYDPSLASDDLINERYAASVKTATSIAGSSPVRNPSFSIGALND